MPTQQLQPINPSAHHPLILCGKGARVTRDSYQKVGVPAGFQQQTAPLYSLLQSSRRNVRASAAIGTRKQAFIGQPAVVGGRHPSHQLASSIQLSAPPSSPSMLLPWSFAFPVFLAFLPCCVSFSYIFTLPAFELDSLHLPKKED